MDASSGQHKEMDNNSLESMFVSSKAQEDQKKPLRPQPEKALKCPRCDSTNTKFCYYNNYSLSQPRYFCKSCRRYWTNGGTLRNVPVGGGCRKNKRSSSSSSSKRSQDQPLIGSNTNPLAHFPHLSYDTNDHLSLAFARLQKQNGGQLGFDGHQYDFSILGNPTSTHCDILRNPSITMSNAIAPSFTPNNFQNLYYGFGNGSTMEEADHHHHHHHDHGVSAEMLMPFGDHHQQMSTTVKQELCNSRESESNMVLWGFPRQLNNMADAGINDLNSTWHGLLNSPLM